MSASSFCVVAGLELEARVAHRGGQSRALEHRARGGHERAHFAARNALERLDALARDLEVRLDLAESLARRIERHRAIDRQRIEIREPSLRLRQRLGENHLEARRAELAAERGAQRRVARARESADRDRLAERWELRDELAIRGERGDRVEELRKCHYAAFLRRVGAVMSVSASRVSRRDEQQRREERALRRSGEHARRERGAVREDVRGARAELARRALAA